MQVKHQKATNHDEVKANLVLQDVIQGNKDISDVPLELLVNIKKVLEKHIEEATNNQQQPHRVLVMSFTTSF
jgi:hypothetical protein